MEVIVIGIDVSVEYHSRDTIRECFGNGITKNSSIGETLKLVRMVNGLRTLTPISDHLIRVELSRDCFDITSYLSCTTDRTDFLDTTIISPFSVALVGCRTGVGICIVDGRLFGVIYTRSASGWAGAIVDFVNPDATEGC